VIRTPTSRSAAVASRPWWDGRFSHLDTMIRLTRLNAKPLVVNAELIALVEANPDTLITLVNGDHLHVRETVDEVVDLAVAYRRKIHAGPVGA
jgi:flagellar protein FlbD